MRQDNTDTNHIEPLGVEAKNIAAALDANAQRLSLRTIKQLENGRDRAIAVHQKRQGSAVNADGTLSHWASWVDHHRMVFAGLALVAIVSSFVMLQTLNADETGDAFLLGADLPPEAFVDKGFEPSLNRHASL